MQILGRHRDALRRVTLGRLYRFLRGRLGLQPVPQPDPDQRTRNDSRNGHRSQFVSGYTGHLRRPHYKYHVYLTRLILWRLSVLGMQKSMFNLGKTFLETGRVFEKTLAQNV